MLQSVGIRSTRQRTGGAWLLLVDPDDASEAATQLELYRDENPSRSRNVLITLPRRHGMVIGVVVYALLMTVIAAISQPWGRGEDLGSAGAMHAKFVMQGEWYRNFTALMLHSDIGHLLSNLLFGTVFGLLAGRSLGGGVAWLTIILAGGLGNFLNACTREPEHISIGASTAVFAALGILIADALHPSHRTGQSIWKRNSPLIAGVVLLSLLGVGGPRTDVTAHVTGFLSGLVLGWFACRLPNRLMASGLVQLIAAVATVGLLALSWRLALSD